MLKIKTLSIVSSQETHMHRHVHMCAIGMINMLNTALCHALENLQLSLGYALKPEKITPSTRVIFFQGVVCVFESLLKVLS